MSDALDHLRLALADRYRIGEEIGRGGMAAVYLADDLKHGRQVAIKVLRAGPGASVDAGRFLREIRIAARLAHPQILPLHDSGLIPDGGTGPVPYYVMPYAGCETLRDRLRREGQLPVDTAVRIARAVASALDYAHRLGVLHRDIKPENILLQEGEPVIADFGVALALSGAAVAQADDEVTRPGLAVGTPAYMSPEQASAERDLDGRSDQYALTCVLYEMLAGQPPFAGSGARETMARHATETPVPVGSHRPGVPPAVDLAVARALAKDPEDRFATMAEFADALVASAALPPPAARDARAVAVLPFVNASPDPENEYLSDGMTDELITALSRVQGLHVASRTSVFALKDRSEDVRALGARLGVSAVLEGTVRRAGSRLRITARLVGVADGRTLWAERYDRELTDVFDLQDEIARTIVGTLRDTLLGGLGGVGDPTPVRYTANLRAYTLYLKGRYAWNRRTQSGLAEAIGYFEQAIAEDPTYAPAYSGLSDAYGLEVDYRGLPVQEGMERAKLEARRALALDERLAEAHTSLGWAVFIYDWDWPQAGAEFRRAIELNPRYATARQWHAWFLMAMGRMDEALAEGRAALELDAASVSIRRSLGWLHYYARQYGPARDHFRHALALHPNSEENHRLMGLACLQLGLFDEAEAEFREAVAASAYEVLALAGLGQVAARRGCPEQAREALGGLLARAREGYLSPVPLVTLYAELGERDPAFEWLERAYAERRGWLAYLRVEPALDPLRADPRFARLVTRMRLT